jgi:DNA-binding PadR family transcriptional regulator
MLAVRSPEGVAMSIPRLTYLQFLVLSLLRDGDRSGRHLRDHLAGYQATGSGPAFYQMMARLEESGYVEGNYESSEVRGYVVKERVYGITVRGNAALEEVRLFYTAHIGLVAGG